MSTSVDDETIIEVLRSNDAPRMTTTEVAEELPITRGTTRTRLQRLVDDERLDRKTEGNSVVWWLSDRAEELEDWEASREKADSDDDDEAESGSDVETSTAESGKGESDRGHAEPTEAERADEGTAGDEEAAGDEEEGREEAAGDEKTADTDSQQEQEVAESEETEGEPEAEAEAIEDAEGTVAADTGTESEREEADMDAGDVDATEPAEPLSEDAPSDDGPAEVEVEAVEEGDDEPVAETPDKVTQTRTGTGWPKQASDDDGLRIIALTVAAFAVVLLLRELLEKTTGRTEESAERAEE